MAWKAIFTMPYFSKTRISVTDLTEVKKNMQNIHFHK